MVRIRLSRKGYKNNPVYRIVVIDQHERREGRPIEELGYYNPIKKEGKFNKIKYQEWLSKGASATETVQYIAGITSEDGTLVYKSKETTTQPKLSKKAKAKASAS